MSDVTPFDLQVDAGGDVLQVDSAGDVLLAYLQELIPAPAVPEFSQADYLQALLALMPRGRVWPRNPAATQVQVLAGMALSFWRVAAAAGILLDDIFPSATDMLLPDWQETLGLPDPCFGPPATLAIAQAQVVAKFANAGGQSIEFFVALAAQLGYTITITEFTAAEAHHWQVNAPGASVSYFHVGHQTAGDPLSIDPNGVLECIFNRLKPGHTTVSFVYGGS